jgi:hypothetical protein
MSRPLDAIAKFRRQVGKEFKRNSFDQEFLPNDTLEEIVTPDKVEKILRAADWSTPALLADIPDLVDFVCQPRNEGGKRLFLILACMAHGDKTNLLLLHKLWKNKLTDASLPLTFRYEERDDEEYYEAWSHDRTRIDCFGDWIFNTNNHRLFDSYQRNFLAPVFGGEQFYHELGESQVLPFMKKPERGGAGSFGDVSKVEIHYAHIDPVHLGRLNRVRRTIAFSSPNTPSCRLQNWSSADRSLECCYR